MPTEQQRPEQRPQHPADRYEAQTGHIRRAFDQTGVGIEVATSEEPPGEADFLFERGTILVRDQDLARVLEVEPARGATRRDNLINGLTLLELREENRQRTLDVLDEIDREVGVGVATPNHVLSITPISHCPATEPEEVPDRADPDPGVCPCPGDGSGVFVDVVDTGLLDGAPARHAWLDGVQGGRDPFPQPPAQGASMPPYTGHGTFIAGVARCMAPSVQVFVEALFMQGGAALESEVIRRLHIALDRQPDIISLSAGTYTRRGLPSLGFEVFLERLRHHKGVVLVAAAGNDGIRRRFWPAAAPGVVAVGALAANWRSRAPFSNHGSWVDLYAPGEDLVNAFAIGDFVCTEPPHLGERRSFQGMARWSGTSFSTPLVAGLIAARMSRTGENGQTAAAALLATARAQAIHGLGAILLPCLDDGADHGKGSCGCHGHEHHRDPHCGHGHHRCAHC